MTTAVVRDTGTVLRRELRPTLRDPFSLIFSMIQPLFFLALFGPLVVGVTGLGEQASLQWFVPGILVMSALFAASMTGSNLLLEIESGSHERMLVTPLERPALLVGRALKEILPVVVQSLVVVAVVMPFGFDLEPAGALGLVVIALFAVGLGALSYTLALAVSDQQWVFWAVQQTLLFPLMLLSGMLLPIEDGPAWLRTLADFNPLKYIVDAERALFAGELTTTALWGALAAAGVAVAGLAIGVRAMRRATA
ncbi:ABC transporter permease [Capillimicrobium parvum]|uniref:Transport permease protein n=1 Tax=Capillimicrobium parvum TaxID=2884022 RepID=A0A9E6XX55_9ACTN|nr:ABC transporter permease [Capillimicrobium parvum]UGS35708.1 Daunorubicin/doxorubicin resistance ABC transporter permease protein DrrB [Capillimicrobium parvum]